VSQRRCDTFEAPFMAAVLLCRQAPAGMRALCGTWGALQCRGASTAHRKARRRLLPRSATGPRIQEQRSKWALITLSGQTFASSGNDIWCGIADVMGRVGANIEDAAGTSMPSLAPGSAGPDAGASAAGPGPGGTGTAGPALLVSAFRTHIAPFSLPLAQSPASEGGEGATGIAVAIFIKAWMKESSVPTVTNLLHTRFPRLVCTVTVGGPTDEEQSGGGAEVLTGTIRLFGIDQVGQLARIAEVLHRCRVTILNLLVTTGVCDSETGDFVERLGGTLSENVITIAAFDQATFDEAALRREVEVRAHKVGYRITSIILDNQESRSQELAGYYLQRKAFIMEVGKEDTHQVHVEHP